MTTDRVTGSTALRLLDDDDRGGEVLRRPWQIQLERRRETKEWLIRTASSPWCWQRGQGGRGGRGGGEFDVGDLRVRRRLELDSGCLSPNHSSICCVKRK